MIDALMQDKEIVRLRERVGDVVRRNHQYGFPPDPRLQDDVARDAEEATGAFDEAVAILLRAVTRLNVARLREELARDIEQHGAGFWRGAHVIGQHEGWKQAADFLESLR